MPRILYRCNNCKKVTPFLLDATKITPTKECGFCGSVAKRTLSAPASEFKIEIDNGVNARVVEINPDILKLNEERREKEKRRE